MTSYYFPGSRSSNNMLRPSHRWPLSLKRVVKTASRRCPDLLWSREGRLGQLFGYFGVLFSLALLATAWLRQPLLSKPALLIYIPVHLQSLQTLDHFLACVPRTKAVINPREFRSRVDVLILTNGPRPLDTQETQQVSRALGVIKSAVPHLHRVRLTFRRGGGLFA